MGNIPEDIVEGLKKLAKSSDTPEGTVLKEFKQIAENDPSVQALENVEFKARLAYAVLLNRYTSTGGAVQLYIKPLSIPRARQVKSQGTLKYVGNLYALIKLIEKDNAGNIVKGETQYAAGTLWEKAAENATQLSPDKVYKTTLRVTEVKHGIELGGNDASFVETDEKFPSNEEWFKANIEPKISELSVRLGELELNQREDLADIKVVKAMVLDNATGETSNKVEFGRYTVTDDSLIGREEGGPGNYSIWVHPSEVVWDNGSTLLFIGTSNYDDKAEVVRFDCHFVMPTNVALKKEIKAMPVGKEEVSIDSLDAELDKEHEKAEEKLGEDEFGL